MTYALAWLLLLLLSSVQKEAAGQTPPPGFRYASYEVIIPKRQSPRYGHKEPQHVNYLLKIEGKSHLLYLRRKRAFVPKDFPVFTYSKEGDLQVDYPFIRDDCFYIGFVQGMPASLVTLSTCSGGLRGVLQVENKSYEIQPVPASAMFQHVVYRLEEEEGAVRMRCGLTEEERLRQAAMIPNAETVMNERDQDRPWWTHLKHLRLVIVVEHERYVQFGRNETVVALDILNVVHLTNSWYVPIGIQVTLVGMEIWSERNPFNISENIGAALDRFNTWRRNNLWARLPHDSGHLFAYKTFGNRLGLAYVATVCSKDWSSAVDSYTTFSLAAFTNTFAHEQGHILGMNHDTNLCKCEHESCIMAAYHSNSDKFSNCSYMEYYDEMKSGKAQCMVSHDPEKKYQLTYCGNRVVERDEQCDCGSKRDCGGDPCCQADCRFRSGVTCAFGECCSKCQYLPAGTVCRKTTNVCDLPEYCNGTSEWCPEDVYVQDGSPCQDGAFCYHGNCSTHSKQCKMIFGSRATVGSDGCFRELNAQGDRFGNCGISSSTDYKKCNISNALCGRIQCENINALPLLDGHSTIIQTKVNNRLCWGTDYHYGTRIPDIGAVDDGVLCDKDKMCINQECTHMSALRYDCNVTKCQSRGLCNNRKNCHCEYGWAPPYCLEKGYGGSMDSGPPPPPPQQVRYITPLIVTVVTVITVAIVAALAVFHRNKLRQWFSAGHH